MKKIIFSVVALVAVVAFAAAQATGSVSKVNDPKPQQFVNGLFIGSDANALADTANKVSGALSGSITVDFANKTITCEDSSAITITGAAVNDPCFVGMPATLTGAGTGLHGSYTCYVSAANAVKVRHCTSGTADNPGSVTFKVRVLQ